MTQPPTQNQHSNGDDRESARPGAARFKTQARVEFEKWALSYDQSRLNEIVFFPSVRACQQEIYRWHANRGGGPYRMLDVGCATGTLLSLMAREPDAELLVGVDFAQAMVAAASDKFAPSPFAGKLQILHADAERLPFADASFDVLTCCNSFHHYPHQPQAIAEFRRVLRPGGMLILIDGFRDNVIGWVIFDLAVATIEKHIHHASWSEFRDMFNAAGLELKQRKMNVLAPLLVNIGNLPAC